MRVEWEEMANRHSEYRVFMEFAALHEDLFVQYLVNYVNKREG